MLKVLTKRERTILYATIGVIIFAVVFNFFLAPVLTKNDRLNKEIVLAHAKLKRYLWLLSQKDIIQNKFKKFPAASVISGEKKDTLVNALSELEALAKDADIRIIDLRPQASPQSGAFYREVFIDLRTEGTMEGYLKFIYNLENSLSLLRIKKFQLSSKPNTQALEGTFSISQLSGLE